MPVATSTTLEQLLAMNPCDKQVIAAALSEARSRSAWLLAAIPEQRLREQVLPYLSPPLWDLNHVANVEEKWLACGVGGATPLDSNNLELYNMMLQPRTKRGSLDLPGPKATQQYWQETRANVLEALAGDAFDDPAKPLSQDAYVWWNTIIHEHQHQETVLQSVSRYGSEFAPPTVRELPPSTGAAPTMLEIDAGEFQMGVARGSGPECAVQDCDGPAHLARTDSYEIGKFPVTNSEFLEFLEAGGYQSPEYWDEPGLKWLSSEPHHAPLHWQCIEGNWWRSNVLGNVAVEQCRNEILTHVTLHEARAFAKFKEARLPTELEWEKAARFDPESGRSLRNPWGDHIATPGTELNNDVMAWQPSQIGSFPAGASPLGMEHACGDVWEWSADEFHAYPGYQPYPYNDYSETWFGCGQNTLRGGSWASRTSVANATFRNWDMPHRRQIHVGFRIAR